MGHLLGCRNLIKALHWNGIFVTGLDFYYTQAIGECCISWIKWLPFSNYTILSSSPHLKPHFLLEYCSWKSSPYWQKNGIKIQGCILFHVVIQDSFIVLYLPVSFTYIKFPKVHYERRIHCTSYLLHIIHLLVEKVAHMSHDSHGSLRKKNVEVCFLLLTSRTQVSKLGSHHLYPLGHLASSTLLYFLCSVSFAPVPGTSVSYLIFSGTH